ncbi:hypothetical protein P168DRAFT_292013 [Aspergillus campestris IBT 28561]|uniref:DUF1279 domain-containing protein n=1 Tax=Aspergillus campestris (strain IBT 28561) TaxID=1392248 RepID=A0A2I1CW56_ASPC2|nr:uncharacterized protein P168DRAFT_292013 [Aspergillus campestris IBT 28561]PKY01859.1 hypothetical protein P168DRAFT_292013 [Aspergillus campestris IBT 28561]
MHPRHPLLSRWFSQAMQGVPRSPMSRTTTTAVKTPSILQQLSNASRLRQPFSTTATKRTTPHLQSRTLPGRIHLKGNGSFQRRFFFSSRAKNSSQSGPAPSLSQRLKTLSKEYGWSALGVYLLLSAMDFPICFLAVRWLGVERIGRYEHMLVESAKDAMQRVWPRSEEEAASEEAQEQPSQEEQKKGEASMLSSISSSLLP